MGSGFNVIAAPKPAPGELLKAAQVNDIEKVKALLLQGADIDETGEWRETALMEAITSGFYNLARLLIEKGAALELENCNGATPLYLAVLNCHPPIVQLLVDNGASIRKKTHGKTMLETARDLENGDLFTPNRSVEYAGEIAVILETALAAEDVAEVTKVAAAQHATAAQHQQRLRAHAPKIKIKRAL